MLKCQTRHEFDAHLELLRLFLARREAIVERIQGLLNAQRKPPQYLYDRGLLARLFEDCFFALPGVTPEQARLRGQLQEAHWARGFRPRELPGMHNDLLDPGEMIRRAFHLWTRTRWPGRNGRVRYAQTLFDLYLVRQLALLAMRAWDEGAGPASERLAQVQRVLDALWASHPADLPVLVRDARWLIPLAQSPGTDQLLPYFEVAAEIEQAFDEEDRVEIQRAVVCMAGGHLRSYLHYYVTQKGVALDDPTLVSLTRKSNALDFSLLIHGLVPLLDAYERACRTGDGDRARRLALADAICQGVSPDPELFIERVDLLGAYTMVEYLFATTDGEGRAAYTPLGRRHVELLEAYEARIGTVAKWLHEDCVQFSPSDGGYSPYGLLYGYAANLLEHIALKTLQPGPVTSFSLEDAFGAGGADKLDWVSGWRKLPHVDPEVERLYAYPQRFAEQVFARVEQALARREARARGASDAPRTGRLFVLRDRASPADANVAALPDVPREHILSSDREVVAAERALACDANELASDRLEGHFLLTYETQGGMVALSKDVLTEVLGAGRDAKIAGLPDAAAESLRLIGRELVVRPVTVGR